MNQQVYYTIEQQLVYRPSVIWPKSVYVRYAVHVFYVGVCTAP